MEELIKQIEALIELYTGLENKARDNGSINMTMMYINQKIGLMEALEIANNLVPSRSVKEVDNG